MVFKPHNLNSVQIEFGGNERWPDVPITFTPGTVSPTQYGELYEKFREVLGIDSEIAAVNIFDYKRYYKNCFIAAIDTSLWGTDPSSISPIDENISGN